MYTIVCRLMTYVLIRNFTRIYINAGNYLVYVVHDKSQED